MISVIIPVYNGEKYLRKCLDSIVLQTIGINNIQIIAIDDVSTDNSVNILREYENKFKDNIIVVLNKVNSLKVSACSRNIGMEYVKGEYIIFCDQDDWFELDAFEELANLMEVNTDLDYIEYSFNYTEKNGTYIRRTHAKKDGFHIYDVSYNKIKNIAACKKILPGATYVWTKIYRTSFLISNKIFHNDGVKKTAFGDNFFSGLVVMYATKIGKYYKALYNYRIHGDSFTHKKEKNNLIQFERCSVGLIFWKECLERKLIDINPEMVEYIFLRTYYLKTFWQFLLEFDPIPFEKIIEMRNNILTLCPDYNKNRIIKNISEFQILLILLKYEWDEEFLVSLRNYVLESES